MASEAIPLVGDDSQIFTGDPSTTEIEGDGVKTLDELAGGTASDKSGSGMYLVAKMASPSFFPAGLSNGMLFPADGTEVLLVGDSVRKLMLTHIADATGWSLAITQAEIEVTRLIDQFKKYRLGKKDATGTLNSIFTVGVSDTETGIVGRTMTMFKKSAEGNITITTVDDRPLYFLGYIRKTEIPGEVEDFVFGQVYMYNLTLGGSTGNAQSYDSSMRLTGVDPVFYSIEIPLT